MKVSAAAARQALDMGPANAGQVASVGTAAYRQQKSGARAQTIAAPPKKELLRYFSGNIYLTYSTANLAP